MKIVTDDPDDDFIFAFDAIKKFVESGTMFDGVRKSSTIEG